MDNFEMRWYSNNYSLIIKGEQGEEIHSQLRIMANLADKEPSYQTLLSVKEMANSHETSNYDKVFDIIQDLELRFVNKFDELLQEIRQSQTTEETISEDRNSLIKENGKEARNRHTIGPSQ
jgi:hypothetical protein